MRILTGLCLVGLIVGGCRMYGGYGSEDETRTQIQQANQRFAEDLQRAQADLGVLRGAVASASALESYVSQFERVTEHHAALLAEHQAIETEIGDGGSYRLVIRAFVSIVADQDQVSDLYQGLLHQMAQAVDSTASTSSPNPTSRYQAVPPFYQKLEQIAQRPTAQSIAAAVR